MYDPTVFENLKVSLENQLYDLDNLDRRIDIRNRIDRLDMAVMSREFALEFTLAGQSEISAEIVLTSTLKELAAELLELAGEAPACRLRLRFYMRVANASEQCGQIERIIRHIWQPEQPPTQTLSYVYGEERANWSNQIELSFHRRINEDQMEDLPELIEHVLRTLADLQDVIVPLKPS